MLSAWHLDATPRTSPEFSFPHRTGRKYTLARRRAQLAPVAYFSRKPVFKVAQVHRDEGRVRPEAVARLPKAVGFCSGRLQAGIVASAVIGVLLSASYPPQSNFVAPHKRRRRDTS
jgi:hypothetical protein